MNAVARKLFSGNELENDNMYEFACLLGIILGAPIVFSLADTYGWDFIQNLL